MYKSHQHYLNRGRKKNEKTVFIYRAVFCSKTIFILRTICH